MREDFEVHGYQLIKLDPFIFSRLEGEIKSFFRSELDFEGPLEQIHLHLNSRNLNSKRQKLICFLTSLPDIHNLIFKMAAPALENILGSSDIAVQKTINTSIQLPGDDSSLLELHTDTLCGNSPYEVILWFPFMEVFNTASFYLLPFGPSLKQYETVSQKTREEVYKQNEKDFIWPRVARGEALLFSPSLIHGNKTNQEGFTRISCNIRFKNLYTPFRHKAMGEYFKILKESPVSKFGKAVSNAWRV